ncbi:MAG: PEP-CTERM sorting domain-containing protein [Phycisphaeraceae bacterium]|nr:PEP-CTERM sorting domain-containing protein [Phycisphaeraceae bacterium]
MSTIRHSNGLGCVVCLLALNAHAVTPGYVEEFGSGVAGFAGGAIVSHVATGGVGGAADGFLQIATSSPGSLAAYSNLPHFTGNLTAAGVTGFSFYLKDVGADDNLEIHFVLGNDSNFWLATAAFAPATDNWSPHSVDLTTPAGWVQIIGSDSFADALANTDRIMFRHDLSPYAQAPDPIQGEFGVDRITVLIPEPATAALLMALMTTSLTHRRRT